MTTTQRFVGISGGGWNSHSSLAGLVSGGLDGLSARGRPSDLATLFADVEGIAANSGGSWILTQLAYSSPFVAGLEQPSGRETYNTLGYNGQVADLFRGVSDKKSQRAIDFSKLTSRLSPTLAKAVQPLVDQLSYYARLAKSIGESELKWRNIVDNFVYKPYGMVSDLGGKGLDAARQSWAVGKDLVIATAAQASKAVIEEVDGLAQNKIFASTSLQDPKLPTQGQVTPLSLISKASGATGSPEALAVFGSGDVNLDLTTNKLFADPDLLSSPASATLQATMSIIDATTASSSAMALLAAPRTFGTRALSKPLRNEVSTLLKSMSPLAQISGGQLSSPRTLPPVPPSDTVEQRMQRYNVAGITSLADGGYADNTAGAYMVRHIQDHFSSSEPFALTLFMNSSVDPLTGIKMPTGPGATELSSSWVPRDVAKLFGNATGTRNDPSSVPFDGIPVFQPQVPNAKVFDITAWYGEKPDWTYSKGNIEMSYYDLNVQTVDNAAFGVKGGQQGRLHLFITNNKASFAAPVTPSILDEYALNYQVSRDAMANQGGFPHLQEALGLGA